MPRARVCVCVCLLGLTTYRKSLPALILNILSRALIQRGLLDGDNKDKEHSWTYLLVARLTFSVTGLGLFCLQRWGLPVSA